ncbi:MAG: OmpA family protein [Alphaproteobacteria bacterium]|nr:OmpA family protein [Alphaproteobacteria bacterium]
MVVWMVALLGCVPKGKYLELEQQLATTKADLTAQVEERDVTIASLRGDIAKLEGEKKRLEESIAGKEKLLAEKESQLSDMREKNAKMLKDKGALAGEIDAMKLALAELQARKAQADARLKDFQDLLARFKKLIDSGTLQVKIVDGRMVVAMATDVLFASGSATLSKEGKEALTSVTEILASIPDRQFQVEGHTDNDPIATAQFPSNWFLASTRALNVVDHMLANGMSPDRISGASFGEFRPVAENDTKDHKSLNRRIEIVVVPDLSQLPGYDELQAIAQ